MAGIFTSADLSKRDGPEEGSHSYENITRGVIHDPRKRMLYHILETERQSGGEGLHSKRPRIDGRDDPQEGQRKIIAEDLHRPSTREFSGKIGESSSQVSTHANENLRPRFVAVSQGALDIGSSEKSIMESNKWTRCPSGYGDKYMRLTDDYSTRLQHVTQGTMDKGIAKAALFRENGARHATMPAYSPTEGVLEDSCDGANHARTYAMAPSPNADIPRGPTGHFQSPECSQLSGSASRVTVFGGTYINHPPVQRTTEDRHATCGTIEHGMLRAIDRNTSNTAALISPPTQPAHVPPDLARSGQPYQNAATEKQNNNANGHAVNSHNVRRASFEAFMERIVREKLQDTSSEEEKTPPLVHRDALVSTLLCSNTVSPSPSQNPYCSQNDHTLLTASKAPPDKRRVDPIRQMTVQVESIKPKQNYSRQSASVSFPVAHSPIPPTHLGNVMEMSTGHDRHEKSLISHSAELEQMTPAIADRGQLQPAEPFRQNRAGLTPFILQSSYNAAPPSVTSYGQLNQLDIHSSASRTDNCIHPIKPVPTRAQINPHNIASITGSPGRRFVSPKVADTPMHMLGTASGIANNHLTRVSGFPVDTMNQLTTMTVRGNPLRPTLDNNAQPGEISSVDRLLLLETDKRSLCRATTDVPLVNLALESPPVSTKTENIIDLTRSEERELPLDLRVGPSRLYSQRITRIPNIPTMIDNVIEEQIKRSNSVRTYSLDEFKANIQQCKTVEDAFKEFSAFTRGLQARDEPPQLLCDSKRGDHAEVPLQNTDAGLSPARADSMLAKRHHRVVSDGSQRPPAGTSDGDKVIKVKMSASAVTTSTYGNQRLDRGAGIQGPPQTSRVPVVNLLGSHSPDDILYLRCKKCNSTYGSVHSFRKHFHKMHGMEPSSHHVCIQTISETRSALAKREPARPKNIDTQSALEVLNLLPNNTYYEQQAAGSNLSILKQQPISFSAREVTPQGQQPSSGVEEERQHVSTAARDNMTNQVPAPVAINASPNKETALTCLHCGLDFPTRDWGVFKRHVKTHEGPQHKLSLLPPLKSKEVPSRARETANPHIQEPSVNADEQPKSVPSRRSQFNIPVNPAVFLCLDCEIGFTYPFALSLHMQQVHREKTTRSKCCLCQKVFMDNGSLFPHLEMHVHEWPSATPYPGGPATLYRHFLPPINSRQDSPDSTTLTMANAFPISYAPHGLRAEAPAIARNAQPDSFRAIEDGQIHAFSSSTGNVSKADTLGVPRMLVSNPCSQSTQADHVTNSSLSQGHASSQKDHAIYTHPPSPMTYTQTRAASGIGTVPLLASFQPQALVHGHHPTPLVHEVLDTQSHTHAASPKKQSVLSFIEDTVMVEHRKQLQYIQDTRQNRTKKGSSTLDTPRCSSMEAIDDSMHLPATNVMDLSCPADPIRPGSHADVLMPVSVSSKHAENSANLLEPSNFEINQLQKVEIRSSHPSSQSDNDPVKQQNMQDFFAVSHCAVSQDKTGETIKPTAFTDITQTLSPGKDISTLKEQISHGEQQMENVHDRLISIENQAQNSCGPIRVSPVRDMIDHGLEIPATKATTSLQTIPANQTMEDSHDIEGTEAVRDEKLSPSPTDGVEDITTIRRKVSAILQSAKTHINAKNIQEFIDSLVRAELMESTIHDVTVDDEHNIGNKQPDNEIVKCQHPCNSGHEHSIEDSHQSPAELAGLDEPQPSAKSSVAGAAISVVLTHDQRRVCTNAIPLNCDKMDDLSNIGGCVDDTTGESKAPESIVESCSVQQKGPSTKSGADQSNDWKQPDQLGEYHLKCSGGSSGRRVEQTGHANPHEDNRERHQTQVEKDPLQHFANDTELSRVDHTVQGINDRPSLDAMASENTEHVKNEDLGVPGKDPHSPDTVHLGNKESRQDGPQGLNMETSSCVLPRACGDVPRPLVESQAAPNKGPDDVSLSQD